MSNYFPEPDQRGSTSQNFKKPFWQKPWLWVTGVALAIFGIVGSQQSEDEATSSPSSPRDQTIALESVAPPLPAVTEPIATTPAPAPTQPAPPAAPVQQAAPARMPAIPCGMDLQAAQDLIQTTGVFLSRSEDATGQGRMQVRDRNWTVLYATPDPGTPIGEGDVVFFVVKDEEFNGC